MTAHDSGHFESAMQRLPEDDPIHEVHQNLLEVHHIVLDRVNYVSNLQGDPLGRE